MKKQPRKQTSNRSTAAEQAFLATYDASLYPHPSLSVDVALVTADQQGLRAVLIRRNEHPALNKWSLPGGFVGMDESLDDAASRVLRTKAGVDGIFLEQQQGAHHLLEPGLECVLRVLRSRRAPAAD